MINLPVVVLVVGGVIVLIATFLVGRRRSR